MSKPLTPADIQALPVADRLELIEALWDSLDAGAVNSLPVPEWHKAELEARLAAHRRDPDGTRPWDDVKGEILGRLRK